MSIKRQEEFMRTDLGETKNILGEYIITRKRTLVNNDRFYIPKNLVDYFDNATVYFKITEEEAKQYKRLNYLKFFNIILGLVNYFNINPTKNTKFTNKEK